MENIKWAQTKPRSVALITDFARHHRFKGNARTTFAFPFKLQYSSALDPNHVILTDLICESWPWPARPRPYESILSGRSRCSQPNAQRVHHRISRSITLSP